MSFTALYNCITNNTHSIMVRVIYGVQFYCSIFLYTCVMLLQAQRVLHFSASLSQHASQKLIVGTTIKTLIVFCNYQIGYNDDIKLTINE